MTTCKKNWILMWLVSLRKSQNSKNEKVSVSLRVGGWVCWWVGGGGVRGVSCVWAKAWGDSSRPKWTLSQFLLLTDWLIFHPCDILWEIKREKKTKRKQTNIQKQGMKRKRKKIERQKNRTRKNERVTILIINYFWIFNRFQKVSECSAENSFLSFFCRDTEPYFYLFTFFRIKVYCKHNRTFLHLAIWMKEDDFFNRQTKIYKKTIFFSWQFFFKKIIVKLGL